MPLQREVSHSLRGAVHGVGVVRLTRQHELRACLPGYFKALVWTDDCIT